MRRFLSLSALFLCVQSVAMAGTLYMVNDSTRALMSIDTNSLSVSSIGSLGVAQGEFGDLAYDAGSGTLYWAAGRDNNSLFTIDRSTGAATLVGSHGLDDLFALAFNPLNGLLYGQTSTGGVYTLNPTTAAATMIGSNTVYPGGFAWNSSTSQLILSGAGSYSLNQVNTADGSVVVTVGSGNVNDNDLDFDPTQNVFWLADYNGDLRRINPLDGSFTTALTNLGSIASVAYVENVPEPATIVLTLAGLAAMLLRRRS